MTSLGYDFEQVRVDMITSCLDYDLSTDRLGELRVDLYPLLCHMCLLWHRTGIAIQVLSASAGLVAHVDLQWATVVWDSGN